jgi:hypothetical protein
MVVRGASRDAFRVSDLHWGADQQVDAAVAGRREDAFLSATWTAYYLDPSLEHVARASPGTWFAVYQLWAVPAAPPADLAAEVAMGEPLIAQQLRALFASHDARTVAYFTQFAYAHTELHAVHCEDVVAGSGLDSRVGSAATRTHSKGCFGVVPRSTGTQAPRY